MASLSRARRVAVLAAMQPEIRPIVGSLALARVPFDAPACHVGRTARHEVVAAVTAMGTRAAARVTRGVLDAWPVDHLVVVGICGGIAPGRPIGDLVVPEVVLDEASGAEHRPVPLEGTVPSGTLLTSDRLHSDPAELPDLVRRGIVAVDMETAAIGAVCAERSVPWSVLRAISDRAGDPAVDAGLVALSRPDGTPDLRAVLRFLARHPQRLAKLARLGAGMRRAVRASSGAFLAALSAEGGVVDTRAGQ